MKHRRDQYAGLRKQVAELAKELSRHQSIGNWLLEVELPRLNLRVARLELVVDLYAPPHVAEICVAAPEFNA